MSESHLNVESDCLYDVMLCPERLRTQSVGRVGFRWILVHYYIHFALYALYALHNVMRHTLQYYAG